MIATAALLGFFSKFFEIFTKHPWKVLFVCALIYIFFIDSCINPPVVCDECPEFDTSGFIASLSITYSDTIDYIPIHDTITIYDTVNHYHNTETTVEIPANIDSLEVARSYYTEWMVKDTILFDSNGIIVVTDWISQNRIQKRRVYPKILYPHYKIVTKTVKKPCVPRFKLKVGFGVGGWENKFGASIKALAVTKTDKVYGISYDPINKYAEVSAFFTIRFGKKSN